MPSTTSAPTATQSKNDPRAYSTGCIRHGRAFCACDVPAARYVSRTDRNPDRAFYRCANKKCSFWKWESDLLTAGLIPPQPAPALETPQRQQNLLSSTNAFATPRASNLPAPETPQRQQKLPSSTNVFATPRAENLPLSPPQTQSPAKRSYARMSTGLHLSSDRRPSDLSEEARARRRALIEAALAGTDIANHDGSAAPADGSNSDSGEETFRGDYYHESESSDEEYPSPTIKRLRFAFKTEEEEKPLVSQNMQSTPPRRSSPLTVSLPTPLHTSEHGRSTVEVEDFLKSTPPASPTSSTKGARRALEKARERGHTPGSSLSSKKADGQTLGDGMINEAGQTKKANQEPASVPGPSDNTAGDSREGIAVRGQESFQAQLASTIQKSGSNMSMFTSSQTRSSSSIVALSALSTMTAQQATLQTAFHDIIAESERLRRKLAAAEKSVVCKQEYITKLQEEISYWKTRNAELEEFQDQMKRITQAASSRWP